MRNAHMQKYLRLIPELLYDIPLIVETHLLYPVKKYRGNKNEKKVCLIFYRLNPDYSGFPSRMQVEKRKGIPSH